MSERIEIARTVATHLFATEEAIDAAIACAAGLAGFMPVARQRVNVSAAVGQPALEQVIATMSTLGEARRQIVEAHQSLLESSVQARIPAHNFGGFIQKSALPASNGLHMVLDKAG